MFSCFYTEGMKDFRIQIVLLILFMGRVYATILRRGSIKFFAKLVPLNWYLWGIYFSCSLSWFIMISGQFVCKHLCSTTGAGFFTNLILGIG